MKRAIYIFGSALALYVALMSVTWGIGTRQAGRKTESHLDYAVTDLQDTVAGAIDTMLGHVARVAVRHLGSPKELSMDAVAATAKELDIDEMNVVDRNGRIIASNDSHCLGVVMAGDPVMDEFMVLTNGVAKTVSQPFRPHARNPKFRAKYLAAAFPDGNGFVQVGLDERRLARMLPAILGYMFDEWLLGDTGFFLCADAVTGRLVSNPSRHRGEAATLAETGFDMAEAAKHEVVSGAKTKGVTFVQRLFGEKCYCRALLFGGHRFVAALPEREYYETRTVFVSVFAVLLFAVLAAFAFFVYRISLDSSRLKAFYASEEMRRAKDMEIAKTIQTSVLPGAFPESASCSLFADMQAARDIGGDFYDYFHLDATHVAFLVADVSGKGITAALYMMTAKALIKDILLEVCDPAVALTRVNAELSANNPANMFLTAWVGVLDLETGIVSFANAGHNPPVHIGGRKDDGRKPVLVCGKSGPVVAFAGGLEYKRRSLRLEPGDSLFLYTDGVTEALDSKGSFLGEERLIDAIAAAPSAEPRSVCSVVKAVVTAFSEGVPQADDITVLAVRYIAPPRVFVRSFPPTQAGISSASEFLDEILEKSGDASVAMPLHVILDEVCSNIVNHAEASGFEIDIELRDGKILLTFIDDGTPYNPLSHEDPDTDMPAEERPIGGLGILLVKKMASAVSYHRAHNRNFLVVERACGRPAV